MHEPAAIYGAREWVSSVLFCEPGCYALAARIDSRTPFKGNGHANSADASPRSFISDEGNGDFRRFSLIWFLS